MLSKPEGNRVDIGPAADSCVLPSRNEQQDNAIIGNFRRELPELRAANRDDTITAAEGICKAMLAGAVGNDLSIQFQSQFSFIEGFSIEPQQRETLGSWVIERNWCRCVDAG